MPELMSCRQADGRAWELEQFREQYMAGSAAKDQCHTKKHSPDRAGYVDKGDMIFQTGQQSPKKSRAKESSKHFGVRFRPDLQKWVAEIRVAEWKSVDKKVWLGTFDSEEGAARAVDAARKLLKCKKKRPANFPCDALAEYSENIPKNLDLTNLRDESMYKEVTLFVKRKAQEYAATFSEQTSSCTSLCLSDQLTHPPKSDVAPRGLFTLLEDDVYSPSPSPSSFGSYRTRFPSSSSCEAIVMGDHLQYTPTSVYFCSEYSGPPSSAGTSPADVEGSWVNVESSGMCYAYGSQEEQLARDDGWVSLAAADLSEGGSTWAEDPATMDALFDMDLMFDIEGDGEPCHVHDDPIVVDMLLRDEVQMLYVDGQNNTDSWMSGPLQNFNMHGYQTLSNSMEFAVC